MGDPLAGATSRVAPNNSDNLFQAENSSSKVAGRNPRITEPKTIAPKTVSDPAAKPKINSGSFANIISNDIKAINEIRPLRDQIGHLIVGSSSLYPSFIEINNINEYNDKIKELADRSAALDDKFNRHVTTELWLRYYSTGNDIPTNMDKIASEAIETFKKYELSDFEKSYLTSNLEKIFREFVKQLPVPQQAAGLVHIASISQDPIIRLNEYYTDANDAIKVEMRTLSEFKTIVGIEAAKEERGFFIETSWITDEKKISQIIQKIFPGFGNYHPGIQDAIKAAIKEIVIERTRLDRSKLFLKNPSSHP